MSDIVYIRQKYKEITGNTNADDVPIYAMRQVVKAYEKGRKDAIDEYKNKLLDAELYRCTDGNEYIDVSDIELVAEQLKEQTE